MKRLVRVSCSAREQFRLMLAQGEAKFGANIADEKRGLVVAAIENHLAEYPHRGLKQRRQKFFTHYVSMTPFVVVYEYDETELRVLFIVHNSADRRRLKLTDVEW